MMKPGDLCRHSSIHFPKEVEAFIATEFGSENDPTVIIDTNDLLVYLGLDPCFQEDDVTWCLVLHPKTQEILSIPSHHIMRL